MLGRVEGAQYGLIHFFAVLTFILAGIIARIRTGPLTPRPPEEWSAPLSSDGAADARARAQELSPASRALFSSDGPADARPRAADGVEIPSTINHWNADEGVDAPLHFCGDNETEWDDPAIVCDEEFLECGGKFFP